MSGTLEEVTAETVWDEDRTSLQETFQRLFDELRDSFDGRVRTAAMTAKDDEEFRSCIAAEFGVGRQPAARAPVQKRAPRVAQVITVQILRLLDALVESDDTLTVSTPDGSSADVRQLLKDMWTAELLLDIAETHRKRRLAFEVLVERIEFGRKTCGVEGQDLSPLWSEEDGGERFYEEMWRLDYPRAMRAIRLRQRMERWRRRPRVK